jgi:methylmalonyl-CoA mutase
MSSNVASVHTLESRRQRQRIRVVTAASLFDGHDAAINIMRRILQAQGAEVIHLGHDRSVEEIARAAVQEDAQAIAVSSYQGGHMEFFRYLVDRVAQLGAPETRVYGGGGGTITAEEAQALHDYGVARIFRPEDGRELGLEGMIASLLDECRAVTRDAAPPDVQVLSAETDLPIARVVTWLEEFGEGQPERADALRQSLRSQRPRERAPVVGFTGTGGAGKSSVVDELLLRYRLDHPQHRVGLLLVDPTRRRTGGALLGDRIRMNAIHGEGVFVRSLATRQAHLALSRVVVDAIEALQAADFDLIFVETAGIGQSDSEVVDLVDHSLYVMTPEFGAPSQLEKIDMIDMADLVVLNKSDRQGAADAARRAQAVAPQPHGLRAARGRGAGLRHDRAPVERSGCRCAVCRLDAAARRDAEHVAPGRGRRGGRRSDPGLARALPRGDRADAARVPRADGAAGGARCRRAGARACGRGRGG